jgi:F-type H+-transporting ATPase subunit epsilon
MNLTILSPDKTVANERVESVTAPGGAGRFTILRNHAAIISTLVRGVVSWPGGELEITGGIVHVKDNDVKIFL